LDHYVLIARLHGVLALDLRYRAICLEMRSMIYLAYDRETV